MAGGTTHHCPKKSEGGCLQGKDNNPKSHIARLIRLIALAQPSFSGRDILPIIAGCIIYHSTVGEMPAGSQHFLPGEIQCVMKILIVRTALLGDFECSLKLERPYFRVC